jgi:alanine dehydrogenase
VKEPVPEEYPKLQRDQVLFAYLHLAPLPALTEVLIEKKITGIAYETVRERDGSLPLLTPMSEIAGRMAIHVGAHYLEKSQGGRAVLLGGVPGVLPARVVILGGGVVGVNAAKIAAGMGARVTLLDNSLPRLRYLDDLFQGRVETLSANTMSIEQCVCEADLVIGAVLIPGATAPRLVTRQMVSRMKSGAVVVDVSVDQGGCIETSHPTTHSQPIFSVSGVLHYCVANMPAAVPRTSTLALTNATLPYALRLAELGVTKSLKDDPCFRQGVNTFRGQITHPGVADAQQLPCCMIDELLD